MADMEHKTWLDIVDKIVSQVFSGRFLSTIFIVGAYCSIMVATALTCVKLLGGESKEIAERIIVFIIGSFSGTAVGAVIGYHFKKTEDKKPQGGA